VSSIIGSHYLLNPPSSTSHSAAPFDFQQYRYFDARKKRKRTKVKNPFKVLGVTEETLYKDVKKAFLQIAMKHHPDTSKADTDQEREQMRDVFVNSRIAFESLTAGPDGMAIRKEDYEDAMENFDSWFQSETGHKNPFDFDMDPETMKEVAKMTDTIGGGVGGGMDRDGGMWALARLVTQQVKQGGDAGAMLRLDAGDVKNSKNKSLNGELRRRRRR
jgi:hypothetical protein